MSKANLVLCFLAAVAPMPVKRIIYRHLGWKVSSTARVGLSLLICDGVHLGDGVVVGHFNIIKGLRSLRLERGVYVKHLNQLFAQTDTAVVRREVVFEADSQLMSRHFLDCAGYIHIGRNAVIGGRSSQLWTHSLMNHAKDPEFRVGEVRIGEDCYIGASAILVECSIVAESVVAAGAVVSGSVGRQAGRALLYRGNPATAVGLRHQA